MENTKYKRKISLCLQYAAAISASITTIGFGIMNSWSSPALPHLTSSASQFSVSAIQGAWIASLNGCGTIIGYLLNTILIDRLGRKRTLLLLAMPQILSWILIYLGRNWIILCLARVIGGIGYGGGLCATAIYLAEIGEQNTRGVFLTLIKMSINIGIFITMFLGAFLSYNTMNFVLLGIPIIFIISFSYMPDSNQFGVEEVVEEDEGFNEKTVDLLNTVDLLKENSVDRLQQDTVNRVLKEKTLDVPKENTVDVLKENTGDALTENIVDLLQQNTVDDVLKEKSVVVLKENTVDTLKENKVDVLKENAVDVSQKDIVADVLKEKTVDVLKENTEDGLKGNTIDVLKENTVDVLNENKVDLLKENTVDLPKEYTIDVLKENTVDLLQQNTVDSLKESTICLLNERALVLKEKRHTNILNTNQGTIVNTKEGTVEERTIFLNKNHNPTENNSEKNIFWRLFVLRNNQKALLIISVASLTDIFSGHMTIVSYTQQIFDYSGATLKAEHAALVLSVLKIVASLISSLVVERFERRDLFLSTGILAGFAQGLVGLFFFLKMYLEVDVSSITWLPLFGVSMYEVVGSVGLSSLYYVYQGELFSNDVKAAGCTFTNIAYESVTFFIKFHFQIVIDAFGIYTVFWGFGICCVIGSCLTYWISPETKGKSSEEIQKLLRGSKKLKNFC